MFAFKHTHKIFVPLTTLNREGEIERVHTGYNYFVTNYSVTFGKALSDKNKYVHNIFIRPQLLNVLPSYSKSVWYFALEIGLSFNLMKSEI